MEFKRTKPQDELAQEDSILIYSEDGWTACVPKNPENRHYAQFLAMEAEGYEAWWFDEEIDWEQSWENEKAGLTKELEEAEQPSKPVKKSRKKKPNLTDSGESNA